MVEMLWEIVLLVLAAAVLARSSIYAIEKLTHIAMQTKASEYLVGFIIMAVATSLPELTVGIAKGGVIVGAVLASHLRNDFFPIKLTRHVMDAVVQEEPAFVIKPYAYCKGKRVLLVDDFAHSGQTLKIAERAIAFFNPESVRTCAFYRDESGFAPDFCALTVTGRILLPWETGLIPLPEEGGAGSGDGESEKPKA